MVRKWEKRSKMQEFSNQKLNPNFLCDNKFNTHLNQPYLPTWFIYPWCTQWSYQIISQETRLWFAWCAVMFIKLYDYFFWCCQVVKYERYIIVIVFFEGTWPPWLQLCWMVYVTMTLLQVMKKKPDEGNAKAPWSPPTSSKWVPWKLAVVGHGALVQNSSRIPKL